MDNKKVASIFKEMADILEIKGEGFFRVNGYRKGALAVSGLTDSLEQIVKEDEKKLSEIAGIGKALQAKIVELVNTGKCSAHEKMKEGFPMGLLEVIKVRGVGAKKAKLFYESLGVEDIESLEKAAKAEQLRDLPKMGEKSEEEVLVGIEEYRKFAKGRSLINVARRQAKEYIEYLKQFGGVEKIQYAGSLRRRKETIGDIDILIVLEDHKKTGKLMQYFCDYEKVGHVLGQGETKSSVVIDSGIQVDLRVVEGKSFGAALHYFTGSKEHNVAIRDLAKKRGLKVNEYGLFDGEKQLAGESEESMFASLGLHYIEPELRENNGEILEKVKLVEAKDLEGDFRLGKLEGEREEFVKAYKTRGVSFAVMMLRSGDYGLRLEEAFESLKVECGSGFTFYKGIDSDMEMDGSLSVKESLLKKADVVMVSVQVGGRLDREKQSKRIIKAIENPYSQIWGLPTGRILNSRDGMDLDFEKIVKACVANNVAIEICGDPERLDLSDKYIRAAKELGAKCVLSSGAKKLEEIENLDYALGMARRGWLGVDSVVGKSIIG